MAKGWYVLHTFTGHENKVEKLIRLKMEDENLSDVVLDIKVPAEKITEVRNGKKRTSNRKFFPGYILIEMELPDRGWEIPCAMIHKIQGVTGFVGTMQNSKPQPISVEEAKTILQKAGAIKTERKVHAKQDFQIGEEVLIIDGPFDTFKGTIEVVNQEKGKLRVMVGIFGRATPVEVSFSQVDRG
ncbi:antitermination protein NusG [Alkalispirochaeta odontotermitis]|uniref:transcription termination/antitermination protein NusG n=1 Tax=Olavius algarvensis spirochete endosymbiont TaxID=260710 RepID=UPI00052D6230|nr:transcription termination/antitermination protein NusG [Olavius algarvensis spirochete endosymbiont]KGM43072.1 antitermination protein NusG [Alkalispirochaeta odontotermitis]